jgi:hypothetical protein
MEMTIIIFERRGLIKELEEKDDIKLLEIPRMTKSYLSLEILKEVRMGASGRSVPRPPKRDRRGPCLPAGRKGRNMDEISFVHILFATGVSGKPRRACPVLTRWARSFI